MKNNTALVETNPIELDSLFNIQYGMYIVTSIDGEKLNGQVATTVMQVTDQPVQVTTCLAKSTLTHDMICKSKVFGVSIIDKTANMVFIGHFGFQSGRDINKFQDIKYTTGKTGVPLLSEHTLSTLEGRVEAIIDLKTHTLFIGKVESAHHVTTGEAMTYQFYHTELKGKSPANAPTHHVSKAKEAIEKNKSTV